MNLILIRSRYLRLKSAMLEEALYFLYSVNSNIKEVKETTEYKMVVLYSSEAKADEILNEAGKQVRKSYIIVWASIMTASVIAVGTEGKCIEKYCYEDENVNDSVNENV